MFSAAWKMVKDTVLAFIDDEALSRGAAIAWWQAFCGLPTFARKLRLVFRPTHHGPRSARPFRANAGNGGRFDQVLRVSSAPGRTFPNCGVPKSL